MELDNSLIWLDGDAPEHKVVSAYKKRKAMNLSEELVDQLEKSYQVALNPVRRAFFTEQQFKEDFPIAHPVEKLEDPQTKKTKSNGETANDMLDTPYQLSGSRPSSKKGKKAKKASVQSQNSKEEYAKFLSLLDENVKWFNKFEVAVREKNLIQPVQATNVLLMILMIGATLGISAFLPVGVGEGIGALLFMSFVSLLGFLNLGSRGRMVLLTAILGVGVLTTVLSSIFIAIPTVMYGLLIAHTDFIYRLATVEPVSSEYVSADQPPYVVTGGENGMSQQEGHNFSPLLYSLKPNKYNGGYAMIKRRKGAKYELFKFANKDKITIPAIVIGNDYYVLIEDRYAGPHESATPVALLAVPHKPNVHVIYIGAEDSVKDHASTQHKPSCNDSENKHCHLHRINRVTSLAEAQELLYSRLAGAKRQSWFMSARSVYNR